MNAHKTRRGFQCVKRFIKITVEIMSKRKVKAATMEEGKAVETVKWRTVTTALVG